MSKLFNVYLFDKETKEKSYVSSHRREKDAEQKAIRELHAKGKKFSTFIEEGQ